MNKKVVLNSLKQIQKICVTELDDPLCKEIANPTVATTLAVICAICDVALTEKA